MTLGVATPYIIGQASWRTIYFVTAGAGLIFWFIVALVVPETKYHRSEGEESKYYNMI